jgi:hypothetical protein
VSRHKNVAKIESQLAALTGNEQAGLHAGGTGKRSDLPEQLAEQEQQAARDHQAGLHRPRDLWRADAERRRRDGW